MRIILLGVLVGVLTGLAPSAFGELYRWRDPQTGSIKYSTYPPPWFGDAAREARSPKVEVLGERGSAAAKSKPADAMAEKVAEVIQFMESRRAQLLNRMTVARASPGFSPTDAAFQQDLQAYRSVTRELDKFDSTGAAARHAADARVFENLGVATLETRTRAAGEPPPPAAGPGFRSGAETTPQAPGAPPGGRSAGPPQPRPVDRLDRAR